MSKKHITPNLSIEYNQLLGKGSTGNVYRGSYFYADVFQIPVAIKVIPLSQINNEVVGYLLKCQLEALKLTSRFYKPQNNPHTKNDKPFQHRSFDFSGLKNSPTSIVQLYDIIVVQKHCYIVMELLEGGTLKEHIHEVKVIPQEIAINILHQLISAYRIIKDHKIVHRDLKPDNIIFHLNPQKTQEAIPKIIDFGYCQIESIKKPQMFYNVGSPRYMSPEAYLDSLYSEKSDIWALGIIFYEMITGTNFDKGKQIKQCFKQIKQKGIPIPSKLKTKTKRILQMMLMFDPKKRQDCEGILRILERQQNQGLSNMSFDGQKRGETLQKVQFRQSNGFFRQSLGNNQRPKQLLSTNKQQMRNFSMIKEPKPEQNRLVQSGILPKNETHLAKILNFEPNQLPFNTIISTPHPPQQKIKYNPTIGPSKSPERNRQSQQTMLNQLNKSGNKPQLKASTSQRNINHIKDNKNTIIINNKIFNGYDRHTTAQKNKNMSNQGPINQLQMISQSPNKAIENYNKKRMPIIPLNQNNSNPQMAKNVNKMIRINPLPQSSNNIRKQINFFQNQYLNHIITNKEHKNINQMIVNQTQTPHFYPNRPEIHFHMVNPQVHH